MNEPKTYRIGHITDLLQVPPERRALCMAEILFSLEQAAKAADVINEGKIFPDGIHWEVGFIDWVDDGQTNLSIGMQVEGGTAIIYDAEREQQC